MSKYPNNGPTLSKSTIKTPRRPPPSPDRIAAEQRQLARDCAERRELNKLLNAGRYSEFLQRIGL